MVFQVNFSINIHRANKFPELAHKLQYRFQESPIHIDRALGSEDQRVAYRLHILVRVVLCNC